MVCISLEDIYNKPQGTLGGEEQIANSISCRVILWRLGYDYELSVCVSIPHSRYIIYIYIYIIYQHLYTVIAYYLFLMVLLQFLEEYAPSSETSFMLYSIANEYLTIYIYMQIKFCAVSVLPVVVFQCLL